MAGHIARSAPTKTFSSVERILSVLIAIAVGLCLSCQNKQYTPASITATPAPSAGQLPSLTPKEAIDEKEKQPAELFVGQDQSEHIGYTIEKRLRKVLLKYPDETGSPNTSVDVAYIRVKKGGKALRKFDADVYFGAGNSADFGFFPFLGKGPEQLFISQDIFRGGRQWIVSLSPRLNVIFNGDEWAAGREAWDLRAVDLDNDGVYEIIVPTCIFYGFAGLSPAGTPLPTIIFNYSEKKGRYLPANPQFSDYLLARIEDQKKEVSGIGDPVKNSNHLSNVLTIVLDYVFAGRENVAWTFYEQAYKLHDKDKIKRDIRAELKNSPVYRFIYRKNLKRIQR